MNDLNLALVLGHLVVSKEKVVKKPLSYILKV